MDSWFRNVGNALAGTGKAIHDHLDRFGQNSGRALDAWGQEVGKNLDPDHPLRLAMEKTGQVSFNMATQTLRFLDGVGQGTEIAVTGAYNHVHAHASQVDWDNLSQEAKDWILHKAQELGVAVSPAATQTVFCIKNAHLPQEIGRWIAEHPGQTTFFVVAGTVMVAPSLISVPVLWSLGFTAEGVAAGSAAAAVQAMIGPVASGSIFALLQSAAAGGAGMAVVNGMVAGTAGVGIAAVAAT
jgi:hypothetical protein